MLRDGLKLDPGLVLWGLLDAGHDFRDGNLVVSRCGRCLPLEICSLKRFEYAAHSSLSFIESLESAAGLIALARTVGKVFPGISEMVIGEVTGAR
jgi:hypothetical protein